METNFQRLRCVAIYLKFKKKRRHFKREYWVHPLISDRLSNGYFHAKHARLKQYPEKFFKYYKMSVGTFEELLSIVEPAISHSNTKMRMCIGPEERLSVTLKYLARGSSFVNLEEDYLIGASTIRAIVKETCTAIWDLCKHACFPALTEERWLEIASEFYRRTQFPNCLGAVDGKHIRLKMPPNSGSNYFNYKSYFSTVLMAVADADYCFTFFDVGAYGKHSDSNIFKNSNLEKGILGDSITLPKNHNLPNDVNGTPMPFVFVGDEAFAVSNHVMRPYPDRNLSPKQRIFNYRLSRARRIVENAFGILSNKWAIFQRSLDVDMKFAKIIIKAACTLHNFVRKRDGVSFEDTLYSCTFENIPTVGVRGTNTGIETRNYITDYFTSPQGSVPWQYNQI